MRRAIGIAREALGAAGLLAMLLLASPGVKVVRAEGPEASGDQCPAAEAPSVDAQVETFLERLQQEQLAAIARGERDPDAPIVLNNRGYNYGPAPGIQLDRILAESRRQP